MSFYHFGLLVLCFVGHANQMDLEGKGSLFRPYKGHDAVKSHIYHLLLASLFLSGFIHSPSNSQTLHMDYISLPDTCAKNYS